MLPHTLLKRVVLRVSVLALAVAPILAQAQSFDPTTLPQVIYHPGGISYWSHPVFANALYQGSWLRFTGSAWGTGISPLTSPQFNEDGYPQYLNPGERLRGLCYGLHVNYGNRPSTWPARNATARGKVVLTWKGEADITLNGGSFLAAESSGGSSGMLVDGRRVYRFTGNSTLEFILVNAINPANPITDIKVWLPDPTDPANKSLENQLFHPLLLNRLADADWKVIRSMDLLSTNGNPQQDWVDRRKPSHIFMDGVINTRAPANGASGNRDSGMSYELLIQLCNISNKDLWLCVPHRATDDFVTKLAQLIRYGSDGVNPYTSPQENPVYPPLNPNLRVFIEYSNEIWSSGGSFPQGNYAEQQGQASSPQLSKARWNARRFAQIFSKFQTVFGGTDRLVRVAAIFTGNSTYSQDFIGELASYGPTLNPATKADVIAVTTYFSNGIQDYVNYQGWVTGKLANDPYWTSNTFAQHMDHVFDEWTRRLLSGDAREGGGPDAVGIGGGYDQWVRTLAGQHNLPIIAYEGGPSIYTDYMDGGSTDDDGVTIFMEGLNRLPRFRDLYRIHLNMAKNKGLWTHSMFVDVSSWGKYGQWGHMEYADQPISQAVKYKFILDWFDEANAMRHVDRPLGAVPQFVTGHNLPTGTVGQPYSADITVTGGNGARTIDLIGSYFLDGLEFDPVPSEPDKVRIKGIPLKAGISYAYLRVKDADGDPEWRTFTIRTVGGPGTVVDADFTGTNPSQNLPWTKVHAKATDVGYSGFVKGGSFNSRPGNDMLAFSGNSPGNESDSTLAKAITDNAYWRVTFTPQNGRVLNLRKAQMSFTVRRIEYHAPRAWAVMTSVGGFTSAAKIYDTGRFTSQADETFTFTFPDTAAYESLTTPVEIRLYHYLGQYGHLVALLDFKLTEANTSPVIVTDATLPTTYEGATYSQQLVPLGGNPPLQWSIQSGSLPPGLELNTSTGEISGTVEE